MKSGLDTKNQTKSLTLLSNSDFASVFLDNVVERVEKKLKVNAYLHWYSRYIPDIRQELSEALDNLQDISHRYLELNN